MQGGLIGRTMEKEPELLTKAKISKGVFGKKR